MTRRELKLDIERVGDRYRAKVRKALAGKGSWAWFEPPAAGHAISSAMTKAISPSMGTVKGAKMDLQLGSEEYRSAGSERQEHRLSHCAGDPLSNKKGDSRRSRPLV